jgi:hypothetical protein
MGRDPGALDFVEEADVARPHRTDRTLTWKERDFEIHDATYRVSVTVRGNEVCDYREYLKIPEQWKRDYQRLRSKNELTQKVDLYGMALLILALLVTIVLRVRRNDVRWRWASRVGLAGIVLGFLAQMNELPGTENCVSEIHKRLKLHNRYAAVCNAIEGVSRSGMV